jgi:hypothetical protein
MWPSRAAPTQLLTEEAVAQSRMRKPARRLRRCASELLHAPRSAGTIGRAINGGQPKADRSHERHQQGQFMRRSDFRPDAEPYLHCLCDSLRLNEERAEPLFALLHRQGIKRVGAVQLALRTPWGA